jgi:hypothetical protein
MLLLISAGALFLLGCPRYCDDNELKNGLKNAVKLDIMDKGVKKTFFDYGYRKIYLLESDFSRNVETANSYTYNPPGDQLPLYHNASVNTFVLSTDTGSDTIRFIAFNPRMVEIYEGCGRSYEIDEPLVEYSTFKSVIRKSFNESTNVLHLEVQAHPNKN